MAGMTNPFSWALLIGLITFAVSYIALLGFAMIRFSYYSGPIPDLFYAIPIPLLIGALSATIAFRVKNSN
jgi:hypothetical protein